MLRPSRVPVRFLAVGAVLLSGSVLLASAACAELLPFRATLTVFSRPQPGVLFQPTRAVQARGTADYTPSGFTLPSGAFVTSHFTPIATTVGGTIALPTIPFSIYLVGQQLLQSSGQGVFEAGPEPRGGFGGVLNAGAALDLKIGLFPLATPTVGSVRVPLPAGSATTVQSTVSILGNLVTVTAFAERWTTGTITYDDRSKGTRHPTRLHSMLTNPTLTSGTARGSLDLGRHGGSISLVTPLVIRVPNTAPNLLAGYARLHIDFGERALVPELALSRVLACAAALIGLGRARRRWRA